MRIASGIGFIFALALAGCNPADHVASVSAHPTVGVRSADSPMFHIGMGTSTGESGGK